MILTNFADCPGNMTAATQQGRCDAVVPFSNPTATDNCNSVRVYSDSLFPNKQYPLGETSETWVAFDAMPTLQQPNVNVASCTFFINVQDNQPPVICE
jgi:hypothetical protein